MFNIASDSSLVGGINPGKETVTLFFPSFLPPSLLQGGGSGWRSLQYLSADLRTASSSVASPPAWSPLSLNLR